MHNQPVFTAAKLIAMWGQPRFILMMGLPASGKTWLSELIAKEGYKRYSSDDCRRLLYKDEALQGDPNEVFALLHDLVLQSLEAGDRVVVDATNVSQSSRRTFVAMAADKSIQLHIVLLDVPYSACLARDRKRSRQVGTSVLCKLTDILHREGLPLVSEGRLTVLRPSSQENCYTVSAANDPLWVMNDIPR